MKKNYLFRTAMCLGIATVLSLCMTAGTYAKYVGSVTGTDSARVAKFDFDISDGINTSGTPTNATITIDLFNTRNFYNTDKTAETGVNESGSDFLVAPGTMGWIPIIVKNEGEVSFKTEFTLSATLNSVPLEFSFIGSDPASANLSGVTWQSDITQVASSLNNADVKYKGASGDSYTVYLLWRWEFSTGSPRDTSDTTLGLAGTATPTVTITCDVTQID